VYGSIISCPRYQLFQHRGLFAKREQAPNVSLELRHEAPGVGRRMISPTMPRNASRARVTSCARARSWSASRSRTHPWESLERAQVGFGRRIEFRPQVPCASLSLLEQLPGQAGTA